MEVKSCHGASQDGSKKLSRFMREVTLARIMKNSCELYVRNFKSKLYLYVLLLPGMNDKGIEPVRG